jgi:hypothetical protein
MVYAERSPMSIVEPTIELSCPADLRRPHPVPRTPGAACTRQLGGRLQRLVGTPLNVFPCLLLERSSHMVLIRFTLLAILALILS